MKRFAVILLFSFVAVAHAIEGDVCTLTASQRLGMRPYGQSICYPVSFNNNIAGDDFDELELGDYLIATGTMTPWPFVIAIESVDIVYLNRLIGKWKDGKNRHYSFTDSNFSVYDPNLPAGTQTYSKDFETYPHSKDKWHIITTDSKVSEVGTIREFFYKKRFYRIELCVYSSINGKRECSVLERLL